VDLVLLAFVRVDEEIRLVADEHIESLPQQLGEEIVLFGKAWPEVAKIQRDRSSHCLGTRLPNA
jgi:hypothetical protein